MVGVSSLHPGPEAETEPGQMVRDAINTVIGPAAKGAAARLFRLAHAGLALAGLAALAAMTEPSTAHLDGAALAVLTTVLVLFAVEFLVRLYAVPIPEIFEPPVTLDD